MEASASSRDTAHSQLTPVVLATRGSQLALWQAHFVADKLRGLGLTPELQIVRTTGDRVQDRFLHEMGGKGVFVRELEQCLFDGRAEIAVHSLKDLPVATPPGLQLAAFLPRHEPDDVLLLHPDHPLVRKWGKRQTLTQADISQCGLARIGSGSLRRACLLNEASQQIKVIPIRGNVDSRVKKLLAKEWDGLILARAAIERLQLDKELPVYRLDRTWFVPSASQGVVVVEAVNPSPLQEALAEINCPTTAYAVAIERGVLRLLGGDCTLPVGVHAEASGETWCVRAVIGHQGETARYEWSGSRQDAAVISHLVVDGLKANGANNILTKLGLPTV